MDFLTSSNAFAIVIEDMDFHLQKRKEGNTSMYNLLAVSDGLINIDYKKMIISSNITSTKDIDEALLRPGRCFDIWKLENFKYEQACNFFRKNNKEDLIQSIESGNTYSLASLYELLRTSCSKQMHSYKECLGFQS
jgi:hypothetical protein